jgi:NAD(P)H dehydrogenase (quinone)
MILVTGAGGKTGRVLIKILSKIESACGFVHREEQVSTMETLGAEKVFVGDLRDESAVRSAMQGAKAVYYICPNMSPDEVEIGTLVIGEAKRAGVEHFVYHSVLHPQTERMTHHWQKLRVEEMMLESGLPFTILQPAPYMQNLLAVWKSIVEEGELRVPYSIHAKFSFLDLEDLAEAARIVLTEPGHIHATYELAGTNPMSHAEVAEIFRRVLGRDVKAQKEDIKDWKKRVGGMSEYALENLVRMFEYYDRWGLAGNPNVLKWVLKREPTSWESFILKNV